MEYLLVVGYVLAILTGVVLGLLGGGGSMLILPILVYLFHINSHHAIVLSMFIVGVSSLIGAFAHFRNGHVNFKIALSFGLPSICSVLLTRKLILLYLPQKMMQLGDFSLDKDEFLLLLFAIMMFLAAFYMIRNRKHENTDQQEQIKWSQLILEGLVVGLVTGLVGAGGGFLIIPALVFFARLPMRFAIGTSLTIISLNSMVGFLSSMSENAIDWKFLLTFTAITCVGILLGVQLAKKIKPEKLKGYFGWFILILSVVILAKELI